LPSIIECTGVNKIGVIKIKRGKEEKLHTHHLCIIDGNGVVSILLAFFLSFYSHHALFIIIFDNDDIVKEQVTAKREQKRT
jgi:hypothetical protein